MDVVISALRNAIFEKNVNPSEIMKYAKICRVEKVIKPIIMALI